MRLLIHHIPHAAWSLLVVMICLSHPVMADSAHDAAYDERGQFIQDRWGNCVRTKWHDETDPCAPPPPKPKIAPPPPPPPPMPVVEREQRMIYFDYDSAKLDGEAVSKLKTLATLINHSKQIADVHIVGFTDQIGSAKYNLALSEKRVKAVETYLDRYTRLDTKAADIRGVGKAPPIPECETVKARKARIDCMQQERRVEIEFEYVKPEPNYTRG